MKLTLRFLDRAHKQVEQKHWPVELRRHHYTLPSGDGNRFRGLQQLRATPTASTTAAPTTTRTARPGATTTTTTTNSTTTTTTSTTTTTAATATAANFLVRPAHYWVLLTPQPLRRRPAPPVALPPYLG